MRFFESNEQYKIIAKEIIEEEELGKVRRNLWNKGNCFLSRKICQERLT